MSAKAALREAHKLKIAEDVCVPRGALVAMLDRIDRVSERFDLPFATFGHAGDGNLHVNILCDEDRARPEVARRLDGAVEQLFRDTLELRGTLSGEHGIGLAKQKYMPMEQSEALMEWQRRWKRMWDPDDLLNPGKIFPLKKKCPE